MNIIYEDNKILVVYKKAGQLTQSGKSFDRDLTSEVLAYRKKKGEEVYVAVINRLDRPVSGLVLFAKTKQEAGRLSKQLQAGAFNKHYYAVICGKMSDRSGRLVDYLKKDEKNNVSAVVSKDEEGGKRAELEYEVLRELGQVQGKEVSLVKIHLLTGRHHQIRVQFASRGCPLVGDEKYGSIYGGMSTGLSVEQVRDDIGLILGRQEIALCAYELEVDKKVYSVSPQWAQR